LTNKLLSKQEKDKEELMNFKNLSKEINRLETKVKKIKEKKIELEKKIEKLSDEQRKILELLDILYELKNSWKKFNLKNKCPERYSTFLICANGELKPALPIEIINTDEEFTALNNVSRWLSIVFLKDLVKSKCPYCSKEAYVIKRFYPIQGTSPENYRTDFLIICCNEITVLNSKDISF